MLSRWSVPYFIMKEREILKLLKILPVGGLARKIIERSAKRYLIKRFQYERGFWGRSGENLLITSQKKLSVCLKRKEGDTQKVFW